jgi:hypothetical protein
MQLTGIDATLKRLAEQLPTGQTRSNAPENFQALIESLGTQIKAAIAEASSRTSPPSAAIPSAPEPPTVGLTQRLTAQQQSLLRASAPMLMQLPDDLRASDSQYNEREVLLRGGLDLDAVERRLRASAKGLGVDYDRSDLEGILRNAGYGAAHLGSTERYMAAVETLIGEAEQRYQQRSGNTPGANA